MRIKPVVLRTLLAIACLIGFSSITTVYQASAPNTSGPPEPSQDPKTAYLVVRFAEHDTIVRAVTFSGAISALEALEISGLEFTTADTGFGPFLCSISEVGDSTSACDNGDRYWATYEWDGAQWAPRMVGIGAAMLDEDGDVEGFSWSDPAWAAIAPPLATPMVAAQRAINWLLQQRQNDGGYGTPGSTADVLMALGANRQPPEQVTIANMLGNGRALASTAAGAGKLAMGLSPHNTCWPYAANRPLDFYDQATGGFDAGAAPHALAMLGMAALDQAIPSAATAYLVSLQQVGGGWEWGAGWGADTNSTALALQALVSAGEAITSTAILDGLAYLEQAQNDDGGFPYAPDSPWGTDSDANSTAYVVQALLAVGQDPLAGTWVTGSSANPITYLLSLQLGNGSLEWQAATGASQLATQQAIPALLGRPFPIRVAEVASCRPMYLPIMRRGQ